MRPGTGWREPAVGNLLRRAVPSIGLSAAEGGRYLGLAFASATIPGGWVAFQIALNFYSLPVALTGKPVGVAMLRPLARLHNQGLHQQFVESYQRAQATAAFLAVPAGLSMVFLCGVVARGTTLGAMANPIGIRLLTWSIASCGLGVLAAASFEVARHAALARNDVSGALRATWLGVAVFVICVPFVLTQQGALRLGGLGLALTLSDMAAAGALHRRILGVATKLRSRTTSALKRATVASAVMIPPALLMAHLVSRWTPVAANQVALFGASGVGLAAYLSTQRAFTNRASNRIHSRSVVAGS